MWLSFLSIDNILVWIGKPERNFVFAACKLDSVVGVPVTSLVLVLLMRPRATRLVTAHTCRMRNPGWLQPECGLPLSMTVAEHESETHT